VNFLVLTGPLKVIVKVVAAVVGGIAKDMLLPPQHETTVTW
jgi:hypothetical protein